jgi:tetratricopeptide (TPR) repeat protein
LKQRDGNVEASRLCAGCHDPIPLLSGEFDREDFSADNHASASAGLTCSVCHSITSIDSVRGNNDFTVTVPEHYPFAFSDSAVLHWFSNLLIKSNPDFHRRMFLKPLHKTAEFCSTCHKVHIPPEINRYVWLRGQDHYDSFLLSGVSGHSVSSFYYPEMAFDRCASCHMPPLRSDEFGASHDKDNLLGNERFLHDHLFAAANTALTHELENDNQDILNLRQSFLAKAATVDIIGIRQQGRIDGKLVSPLEGADLRLQPGETYLLEVVVRTTGMGHAFTQGTSDSNQLWLELQLVNNGRIFAQNGVLDAGSARLSANSHMINSYLIDKAGNRISRRNAEDIHTVLYDHQIPPGAADAIHYRFTIPREMAGSIDIAAALKYRKFDTDYYLLSTGSDGDVNPLPVTTISRDRAALKLTGAEEDMLENEKVPKKALWERLNDYGIGLFRKPDKSQFRQAEAVFKRVEALGRQEGTLNLARLYYSDGRLEQASAALDRLDYAAIDNPWTVTWLAALIDRDNGYLDEAITLFEKLINTQWSSAAARGFDFSKDYRLLNTCASTLLTRARMEKPGSTSRQAFIDRASAMYERALSLDPENVAAHYGMMQVYRLEGKPEQAKIQQQLHKLYKPDDSSRDTAIGLAREKDPYADLTANPVVIYDLVKVN